MYCYKLYNYQTKTSLYIYRNWRGGYTLGASYSLVEPESCVFDDTHHNRILRRVETYTRNAKWVLVKRDWTHFFDVWSRHNRTAWYRQSIDT